MSPVDARDTAEATPPRREAAAPRVPAEVRAPARGRFRHVKQALKWIGVALGLALMALPAATCKVEAWLSDRDDVFVGWGQLFALVPGLPGKYLRKCYYFWTLRSCSLTCEIGFLSYFTLRQAEVGERVYIGARTCIGGATLGEGALIGSRVSILNGGLQHEFGPDGRLTPCHTTSLPRVRVGEETWVGEGAILMADVGSRCIVAAGSVVSGAVPDGTIVGGNPARFVGKVAVCHPETAPCSAEVPVP
jgi:acetyltransferase-like isoleucine patch superfamily enzyme